LSLQGREIIMVEHVKQKSGTLTLSEIREFASFSPKAQRFIRLSLDIAFDKEDAEALWSRDEHEMMAMAKQKERYSQLEMIRKLTPNDENVEGNELFFAKLMEVSSFDILQGKLDCFASYRFLYERLLGPNIRPWLPAIFCATSSLPQLEPAQRKKLLQSISEAAATAVGWSKRAPSFFPEWVQKVETDY